MQWESGLCSRSPSSPGLGARPAIQRAGPAACWVCGVRAGQVPKQLRACRHSAARPGHGQPRQARAGGRTRGASRGALAPLARPPGPASQSGSEDPSPPPGDTAGLGPRRPARGCGGGGSGSGRGRRAAPGGRERAPAPARRPARPFRLLRARPRPPHPGQPPAAPPSRQGLCCRPGRSLASQPGPVTCLSARLALGALCTVTGVSARVCVRVWHARCRHVCAGTHTVTSVCVARCGSPGSVRPG